MKTTLLFVRHGQSAANVSGFFAGRIDVPLSPLGRRQTDELKEHLLNRYSIDAIYSSDLSRAYETVLPAASALRMPIRKDAALREIDGGKWEGMPKEEIAARYPQDFAIWRNNIGLSRCTGGESMRDVQQRGIAETEKIVGAHPGQTVLLATHAGFLRAMQCHWQNLPLSAMEELPWVPNASVTEVEYSDGKHRITLLGDVSFLHGDITTLNGNM